ncbi:hypothetical protein SLEP1_g12668 [Rubroshorea leprosula]|uniref:NB-ARC domain-containing protein n=1 Tax=Rubroshorea leprosula TaxID=152421 RepID=A0AAV5INW3_9ROSI|nr:hypothetical protein SLEP1_g12668 [Rubroshorea leprosula]
MAMNPFLGNVLANATGNLLSDCIEGVANYVGEHIGLSNRLEPEDNFESILKSEAEKLRALRDDNEREIRRNKTKTTSSYYNQWLGSVTKILPELETLQAECEQQRNVLIECAIGSKFCEKVINILQRVQKLIEEGKFPRGFLIDKPPEPVIKLGSVPDIKATATLRGHLEEILLLLSCEEVKTIVIWGPLGVGKTTIMQNLNNHEEVAKMFQMVIWITVSEERTIEKLQMEIASRLKLNLRGTETAHEVARSISEELNDRKYLLLLDDVKGIIDHDQLNSIGVPDNENGSKLVLTTEDRRVCSKMEFVRDIEVEKLTQREAWEMFKQIVTDQKIKIPGIKSVAQRVAKECGGLPLVIKTVASYFKFKDTVAEWRNGLEELRNGSEVEIPRLTQIHAFLKCCYDDLKDENKKRCFLYGALHPADTNISTDYLVMCWAAERFLGNVDDRRSFRAACDKGYVIVRYLTNVSLLQTGKRMEHVQVNNVVRQVALHISSEDLDNKFLIGDQTETSPIPQRVSDWEQATRIFMIDAKLEDLPNFPRCNKLLSLLLQRNPDLRAIPPSFFEKMQKLLVLNLCKTGIMSLPQSFEKMTGLKALFLNDCTSLTRLPLQMRQLSLLEVLDIRGCKVIFIPPSIGNLVQLRCLRVSYYKPTMMNGYEGMETDYNVISWLFKLEELVIDVISYDQWRIEATNVIKHVASLKRLTSLKICFPKPEVLWTLMKSRPEWQSRQQLASFWSFIGCQNCHPLEILDHFSYPIDRYLRYEYDGHHIGSSISNMFPETDALELIGHNNISCFTDFMQTPRLNGVVGCLVERCSNMVTIVGGNNAGGTNILPSLEQLHLRNLLHLKTIFEGPLSQGSLSELQTIAVKGCPMLTEISSNGLIQQLPKLTRLTIENCDEIKQLIQESSGSGAMPNLEVLELVDMKKLETICADESLAWPKLKELQIYQCGKLKRLPFNRENAAGLKMIKGEQAWWDNLSNEEFKEHFQSFGILRLGV